MCVCVCAVLCSVRVCSILTHTVRLNARGIRQLRDVKLCERLRQVHTRPKDEFVHETHCVAEYARVPSPAFNQSGMATYARGATKGECLPACVCACMRCCAAAPVIKAGSSKMEVFRCTCRGHKKAIYEGRGVDRLRNLTRMRTMEAREKCT